MMGQRKKLALVLSGGSARGLAHIGFLQVLEEHHIPIDIVVGTSMGALIGGMYAGGRLKEFTEHITKLSNNRIVTMLLARTMRKGNNNTETIKPFLKKFTRGKRIEKLDIPFVAVATDLKTGREVFIDKGDLLKAILASISIPGIFRPVKNGKMLLVDGGVVDPLPQRYGHVVADKVISVNAMPTEIKHKDDGDIYDIISEAVGIMTHEIIRLTCNHKKKTVFVQLKTNDIDPFDFSNIKRDIDIGRKAAEANINKIIKLSKQDDERILNIPTNRIP